MVDLDTTYLLWTPDLLYKHGLNAQYSVYPTVAMTLLTHVSVCMQKVAHRQLSVFTPNSLPFASKVFLHTTLQNKPLHTIPPKKEQNDNNNVSILHSTAPIWITSYQQYHSYLKYLTGVHKRTEEAMSYCSQLSGSSQVEMATGHGPVIPHRDMYT